MTTTTTTTSGISYNSETACNTYTNGSNIGGMILNGFCVVTIPIDIGSARTIVSLSSTSFLVLDRSIESVVLVNETTTTATTIPTTNNNNTNEQEQQEQQTTWTKQTLVTANRLNHGLVVYKDAIYASSDNNVYRWNYTTGNITNIVTTTGPEILVTNINENGIGNLQLGSTTRAGHVTRTLLFDTNDNLYISVGSIDNIDNDSYRSRIRKFTLSDLNNNNNNNTSVPLEFSSGTIFADGLRNEVGLAFDITSGTIWGVENSADKLYRIDLGGDISADNPAEELHQFDMNSSDEQQHYGYPYCFTAYNIPMYESSSTSTLSSKGTVWAWPTFLNGSEPTSITDEECRQNYKQATVPLQGHSAPLGLTFYNYYDKVQQHSSSSSTSCTNVVPFPSTMDGYIFIAYHGSWNRIVPTGYKVVYIPTPITNTSVPIDLLYYSTTTAQWPNGFRPVDVDFDECGRLLVSSDGTYNELDDTTYGSKVIRIEATMLPTTISPSSTGPMSIPISSSTITPTTTTVLPTTKPSILLQVPSSAVPPVSSSSSALPTLKPLSSSALPITSPTTLSSNGNYHESRYLSASSTIILLVTMIHLFALTFR